MQNITEATSIEQIAEMLSPKVELTVGGQKYRLLLDHAALIEAEDLLGINILCGDGGTVFRPSAKVLRALLYVVLKRAGATFDLQEAGNLITPGNILKIQEAIQAAWFASMQEPDNSADPQKAATTGQ